MRGKRDAHNEEGERAEREKKSRVREGKKREGKRGRHKVLRERDQSRARGKSSHGD